MTTTLRPTGPIQHEADGARSRHYEVCVNSRPVGTIEIATHSARSPTAGAIRSLRIDEADRRRGRGTVAALAAEEVLRGWGCTQVLLSVPPLATAGLRLTAVLGYTERGRNMSKDLPEAPPALPAHVEGRPMSKAEFVDWRVDAVEGHAQTWIDQGVPAPEARARSEADHCRLLPEDVATPGISLNVLLHQGSPVGHLFVGRREERPGRLVSYVYDVKVTDGHRGQGHGRSLMLLAERVSLAAGMRRLGLHVFTGNTPAIRLYESLGYEVIAVNLYKQLL